MDQPVIALTITESPAGRRTLTVTLHPIPIAAMLPIQDIQRERDKEIESHALTDANTKILQGHRQPLRFQLIFSRRL